MENFRQTFKNISASDVQELMNQGDVTIIDVREPYEYAMGHIEVARSIPLGTIPNNMASIDKDKKVVAVCASGARSSSASEYLASNGYEVYNLVGGMMGWRLPVAR